MFSEAKHTVVNIFSEIIDFTIMAIYSNDYMSVIVLCFCRADTSKRRKKKNQSLIVFKSPNGVNYLA